MATILLRNCNFCGKEYKPDHSNRKSSFCSRSCRNKAYPPKRPRTKIKIKNCEFCHKLFEYWPSVRKQAKYCSFSCLHKGINKRKNFTCKTCGKTYQRSPSTSKNGTNYCSLQCLYNRPSKAQLASINGSSQYYGPNWQTIRKKVKNIYNYKCADCGNNEIPPKYLHVHHIKPFLSFKNFKSANKLTNLVSLCPECHRKRHFFSTPFTG